MATSEKQHAEVTQEMRDFVRLIEGAMLFGGYFSDEAMHKLNQLLADYAAEVERKARLDALQEAASLIDRIAYQLECCDSHQEYQEAQVIKPLARKIAELRGTNG